LASGAGLAFGLLAGLPALRAATTERVVVDWHTGLAIDGFDPVAYFTDAKPMLGSDGIEFRHAGAVWRFCNTGNRDAFAARPDVYMPQFGGYDPVSAARGVAVAGNPLVWLISGERLYLFYNNARRATFDDDPERVLAAAGRKWPAILGTLTP
jgi:YHS domain-containing protein